MSLDTSGGGLWPDDDGEINMLTNNIGLWPQVNDDVPDETSQGDEMFLMMFLSEGCSWSTMPDDDEDVLFWIHLGSYVQLYH